MKKLVIVGAGITVAAAVLAKRRRMWSAGGFDIERWIDRMPENAPPRWIFNNISAIRDNTERILQLLEKERTSAGEEE